jgi:type I restriction-modification system DNA methylase subunit
LNHQSLSNFIWSVADLLRGDYKQSEYGRVILPFTVLRRLDCVLAPTKQAVLEQAETGKPDPFLLRAAGHNFFNRSTLDLGKLIGDQDNIGTNLLSYIQGFSPEVRDIFDQFEFGAQIDRLAKNGLLYQVTERFAGIDLQTFDYMLSNPPFGVEWKKVQKEVQDEHQRLGHAGRFGPGLPRVSDGSLLFLMHLLAKMRPWTEGGCRFGIVLNGSPLFTGGAGSGESEIRRYVLESDLVEAIIALPTDMFYNTVI